MFPGRWPILQSINLADSKMIPDIRTLCQVRLVSKTLYKAATPALLRLHEFELSVADEQMSSHLHDILHPRGATSIEPLAPLIQRIRLDLTNKRRYAVYYKRKQAECQFRIPYHEPNFLLADPYDVDDEGINRCEELAQMLPAALSSLKYLSSFELNFPTWEVDLVYGWHSPINVTKVESLLTSIVRGLQTPFEHLSSLYLSLLCTHDVQVISEALPRTVKDKLVYLHLSIKDSTGPGGSDKYLEEHWWDDGGDENDPNAENEEDLVTRISEVQRKYPNATYQSAVFTLISECPRLKGFGLSCTQFLQIPKHPRGNTSSDLEVATLYRVRTSSIDLLAWLLPEETCPSSLLYIWLWHVELTSGT